MRHQLPRSLPTLLCLALALVGCGGTTVRTAPLTAADYRTRAEALPTDPDLALARAEAELFVNGGDATTARDAIAHAAELGASPLRTRMLAAIEADVHAEASLPRGRRFFPSRSNHSVSLVNRMPVSAFLLKRESVPCL